MLDLQTRIATLERPQLLARAAHFGVDDYRRDTHLHRNSGCERLPKHGQALMLRLDREAELDQLRRSKSGDYRPAHQVEVLIAILGEAQLMRATALNVI